MFVFGLRNLWARPVRSLLAIFGLTVAIAGMVGLFSVAQGIDRVVDATFGGIPGLAVMQPGAPIPLFSRLPTAWGTEIAAMPGVRAINPEVWVRAHVIDGKPTVSPPRFLFGVSIPHVLKLNFSVYQQALCEGRFLAEHDRGKPVAVVSRNIAKEYHKRVGDTLRVDSTDLTIVGLYETKSMLLDVAVLVDEGLARSLSRLGDDTVCAIYVEPEQGTNVRDLARAIRERFRGRVSTAESDPMWLALRSGFGSGSANGSSDSWFWRMLADSFLSPLMRGVTHILFGANSRSVPRPNPQEPPANPAVDAEIPVDVRSAREWSDEFKRFSADLDLFLAIMTSIGMTIAVLGIVNTMLMSVSERIIEFGILKANGWANRDVLWLVSSESLIIGTAGGVAGTLLGWLATAVVNGLFPNRIHLFASAELLLFSVAFAIVMGLLGGLYPAWWASRLMPMDAIRRG